LKGDDWDRDPAAKAWIRNVLEDMVPKMEDSVVVMSLVPTSRGEGDVKYWVELGASIMMDKPILTIVMNDEPIPPKLELVSDEIVRLPQGVQPDSSEELAAALKRLVPDA
jgi:hypothetical protein